MLQDCSVQLVGQGGTRLCSCRGFVAPAGRSGPQRVSRETRNPEDRDLMEVLSGRRVQFIESTCRRRSERQTHNASGFPCICLHLF